MLHLSLVHLPRKRALDPYQAHQLAWKAFPDVQEAQRPFLFSLEHRPVHHSLLVQSTEQPDWNFLDGRGHVQTKVFDPARIDSGSELRFFLRANPTVDRKGFDDEKKRRVAVGINPKRAFERMGRPDDAPTTARDIAAWRRSELIGWIERKGKSGGFEVLDVEPGPIVARRIVRNAQQRSKPMTFHEVEFTGLLKVANTGAFIATLSNGIGRGKAFGYGLLMVRAA